MRKFNLRARGENQAPANLFGLFKMRNSIKDFKRALLNNDLLRIIVSFILMLYLRLVYLTARWRIVNPEGIDIDIPTNMTKTILFAWHNQIAIMPFILRKINKLNVLASSHPDGMIIARVLKFFFIKVIYGSTNRNAFMALRQIISTLKSGGNVGITPDGPKGPIYKINSNLGSAAKLANAEIVIIGSYVTKYIELKSWDRFIFPLLFAKGTLVINDPISIMKDMDPERLNQLLEEKLNSINLIAQDLTKNFTKNVKVQ